MSVGKVTFKGVEAPQPQPQEKTQVAFKGQENTIDEEKSNATKYMVGATVLAGVAALAVAGYHGHLGEGIQKFLGGAKKAVKDANPKQPKPNTGTPNPKKTNGNDIPDAKGNPNPETLKSGEAPKDEQPIQDVIQPQKQKINAKEEVKPKTPSEPEKVETKPVNVSKVTPKGKSKQTKSTSKGNKPASTPNHLKKEVKPKQKVVAQTPKTEELKPINIDVTPLATAGAIGHSGLLDDFASNAEMLAKDAEKRAKEAERQAAEDLDLSTATLIMMGTAEHQGAHAKDALKPLTEGLEDVGSSIHSDGLFKSESMQTAESTFKPESTYKSDDIFNTGDDYLASLESSNNPYGMIDDFNKPNYMDDFSTPNLMDDTYGLGHDDSLIDDGLSSFDDGGFDLF